METPSNRCHEDDDTASDGGRPRKRQREVEVPSRQIRPEADVSGMHTAKKKPSIIEQAASSEHASPGKSGLARNTIQSSLAESSRYRKVNSTSTAPTVHKANMRYINNELVNDSIAVVETLQAKDQDVAMGGKQRG